jgi:hypothetical protein
MTFLMKTSETKKFVKIFCEAFFIVKNILLQPSRTYFHFYKKCFLNSQAVRIRVNYYAVKNACLKKHCDQCHSVLAKLQDTNKFNMHEIVVNEIF